MKDAAVAANPPSKKVSSNPCLYYLMINITCFPTDNCITSIFLESKCWESGTDAQGKDLPTENNSDIGVDWELFNQIGTYSICVSGAQNELDNEVLLPLHD